MKTIVLFGAILAALGLAIVPADSQTQSSTSTGYVQTSKIVGMKVKDARGEEVGVVKDVVLDRNTGCMAYTVLSTGGTTGRATGSAKTVAVPWSVYSVGPDPSVVTVRVDRERIYNAPVFDYGRIDEYSTSGYINNVYSYYGVQPGIGVGVGVGGTSTTTTGGYNAQTGVAGQTGAYASPGATAAASPAIGGSPAMSATPAMSPAASASPTATAKTSPTSTAAGSRRGRATPSASAGESPAGSPETGARSERGKGRHRETSSPGATAAEATGAEGAATGTPEETTTSEGRGARHKKGKASSRSSETETRSSPSGGSSAAEPTATP